MKKVTKAVAAIMLMTAVIYPAECLNAQTHKGHDYVDLGLPSGTLWATCNVGATTSEGYGDYFAWGETRTKSIYNWETYKYAMFDHDKLTKYCRQTKYGNNGFTDNLTVLQPSDDAATANWGGGWRIPTDEEWEELIDNCTSVWATQNGVRGRRFTGLNGNTLFLPAAGFYHDSEHRCTGDIGDYWSSSLTTYSSFDAGRLRFDFERDYFRIDFISRASGMTVRAVRSAK